MKIYSVGAEMFHEDEHSNEQHEANSRFDNFAKSA
jgi:hypothetical protein